MYIVKIVLLQALK